jgi:uncharacterized protein (DUF58 family)
VNNHLFAVSLILVSLILLGAATVSGLVMVVAAPFLLYLLGSALLNGEAPKLTIARSLSRSRVLPGESVEVTVTVANEGSAVRELLIEDLLPHGLRVTHGQSCASTTLPSGRQISYSYTVTGSRGTYEFTRVSLSSAGDLPLASRVIRYEIEDELVTLPDHRALSRIPIAPRRTLVYSGTLPARRGGEGTEFFDIREHGGEPLRHINWRASARTPDRLYVNEFQQERVADVAVLLDLRRRVYPSDDGRFLFDAAASAAASLADVVLDAGNRVGLLGYGLSLDWLTPGFGKRQKHRLFTRIARFEPGDSHVFYRLDAIPDQLFPAGSQVVLVSPLAGDDYRSLERLQTIGYAVMVVSPDPVAHEWRVVGRPSLENSRRLCRAERITMLSRLRRSGVAVIDWDTAEPLEQAVSRSFAAIRAAWRRRYR